MLQRMHQPFALASKRTFLRNSNELHVEPTRRPVLYGRSCLLALRRPMAFGRNPQSRAAPKGNEQRCLKTFQLPTKCLEHEATIDRPQSQQLSCRPLFHAPQGSPKRCAALLWSRESVFAELLDLAASDLQREFQPHEPVAGKTRVRSAETIRLQHSRLPPEPSRRSGR